MYNIISNFILSKKIIIDKIGISFRPLNLKEKELILKKLDDIYYKNKKIINEGIKKYEDSLDFSMELLKYDKSIQEPVIFCFMSKKSGFSFNSTAKIKKILDNMIIIEIKDNILSEYIEKENYIKFISNILSLYDIYSSNIDFNERVKLDYSPILEDNILNPKEENYNINLITAILISYNKKMMKMTELSEDYLKCLKKFFSKLSKEEIRRFFNSIDLLYSNNIMIQSKIVNNITLTESILIREEENIKANYVLKAGLIFKHYTCGGESMNKFIKDYLSFCYDIRSAIVHGSEEKILDIYNTAIQKNKHIKELVKKNPESYISKKKTALSLAYVMSNLVNRAIIKYWLDEPSNVSYFKN